MKVQLSMDMHGLWVPVVNVRPRLPTTDPRLWQASAAKPVMKTSVVSGFLPRSLCKVYGRGFRSQSQKVKGTASSQNARELYSRVEICKAPRPVPVQSFVRCQARPEREAKMPGDLLGAAFSLQTI